jgi:hypothetical protein
LELAAYDKIREFTDWYNALPQISLVGSMSFILSYSEPSQVGVAHEISRYEMYSCQPSVICLDLSINMIDISWSDGQSG